MRCYVEMYPRLHAEEALLQVSVLNAGDSMIKQGPRQRLISEWQQQAYPERYRVRSVDEIAARLTQIFGDH